MRIFGGRGRWLAAVAAVVAVMGFGGGQVGAVNQCPAELDACLFVNSPADTNARDDGLTLREALLVTGNYLPVGDLTDAERGQLVILSPPGWGPPGDGLTFGGASDVRKFAVYFDPGVFCAGCGRTITLSPPGFGGPGGIGGRAMALPPVADPDAAVLDGGPEWSGQVGPGYVGGVGEVPVEVTIDGTAFGTDDDDVGLWVGSQRAALVGFTMQHFAGAAVEVACEVVDKVTVDLTFANNGTDVDVIGCD